ncbi:ribosomal protein S18-alanine N-acetyltransferase [Facklamia sp. 7083-14-GEN3]|uniref:ribosomal protein S18-alanine N-acetyltransferase n=1 Tax=Facklamia sp. 7083-14-GEN3 TaxID=2973478 RepID=UPI00215C0E04|nr:ribosomal protein S18-alanine N-acetyltransferase [Facklamia sp. 7083-14-GEN3]MCR8969571.1 ribosomal protein S18-alanine N-acetyltransferase [Facklamia sp. 7083-14-GEN3]
MKRVFNPFKEETKVRHKAMAQISPFVDSLEPIKLINQNNINCRVRLAQKTDLPALVQLEQKGYAGYIAWDLSDFERDWQRNPQILYLVIEAKGLSSDKSKIIGMITGRCLIKNTHISQLVIDPEWQSQGLGSYLLRTWIQISRELDRKSVTLEVRESNTHAQKVYYQQGFVLENKKPFYYEDNGESALFLRCYL